MRIVSLLPSATETLFAIGAGDDVVGVTFECDAPPEARGRTIVSTSALPQHIDGRPPTPAQIDAAVRERLAAGEDLYHLDRGALAGLGADLVVTQDLCADWTLFSPRYFERAIAAWMRELGGAG